MIKKLIELVKGKKVQICTHWDADGVASGALVYHLLKKHAGEIWTKTKGKPFVIEQADTEESADIVICVDIQPGNLKKPVIYIDHHPICEKNFELIMHNESMQSTSLIVFQNLMDNEAKQNPYYVFLVVLGYLGDDGDVENMPEELKKLAFDFMPELMEKRESSYRSKEYYYEISRYVSLLNTGKRAFWSGDIPLELLKSIEHYEQLTLLMHPIAQELLQCKGQLRELYEKDFDIETVNGIDYCIISNEKNIQGVVAARHMNNNPIMVLNQFNGEVIGSMRVPGSFELDAGSFLGKLNGKIPTFRGGGHRKAGGFTFDAKYLPIFLEAVKKEGVGL